MARKAHPEAGRASARRWLRSTAPGSTPFQRIQGLSNGLRRIQGVDSHALTPQDHPDLLGPAWTYCPSLKYQIGQCTPLQESACGGPRISTSVSRRARAGTRFRSAGSRSSASGFIGYGGTCWPPAVEGATGVGANIAQLDRMAGRLAARIHLGIGSDFDMCGDTTCVIRSRASGPTRWTSMEQKVPARENCNADSVPRKASSPCMRLTTRRHPVILTP